MKKNKKRNPTITVAEEQKSSKYDYPSIITLFFVACFLAIDYSPIFNTTDVISAQFLELAILNIVIGIYFLINTNAISNSLLSTFKKSSLLKLYLTFLTLCAISILFARNTSLGITFFTQLIITFTSFVSLTLLLYNRLDLIYKICLLIGLSALWQSYQGIKGVFEATSIYNGLIRLLGNTNSINMFSASLSVKIPFIILGIIHFSRWKRILLVISLSVTTTCMLMSGSRTVILALFLALIVFGIFCFVYKESRNKKIITAFLVLIPIAIGFFTANKIITKTGPGDAHYAPVATRAAAIVTDKTGGGRIDLWENALQMIQKNPFVGVGVGNYLVESIPYEKYLIDDLNLSVHNHNDFLEIAAETGILNGLIYLSIFVLIFFINIRKLIFEKQEGIRLIALLTLMLLINYFLDAALNFPMYRPMQQVYFCFLVALSIINTSNTDSISPYKFKDIIVLVLLVISGITTYISYHTFRAYQLESEIELDSNHTLGSRYILGRLPKYPNVCISGEAFTRHLGMYFYIEKKNEEAKKYFNIAKKINPYTGVEDWYLHKILLQKGEIDSAYTIIKNCFYARPRTNYFYYDANYLASQKRDTTEILKIHAEYSKFRGVECWVHTTKALIGANYSPKKTIAFINNGLKKYPNDASLIDLKNQLENYKYNSYLTTANNFTANLQFDKALIYFKKALKENNTDKSVYVNIGICYFQLKNYREAISNFNSSLKNGGMDTGLVEYHLGMSYLNLKDKANGCKFLILANNKKYPGADVLLQTYCK
ncbi:MAG: O-antigen ligase family protein [Sphingobacteriaceae bacterium]|nr:O-antigen ligase family protein [Sphingobacteriaceae bacterium]